MLFEGAQGAMLDIDLGTYPFVTSSNTTVGGAAAGTGVGPAAIDYVLGIVKAYTTRVGAGPFPTELARRRRAAISARSATSSARRRAGRGAAVGSTRCCCSRAVFTNSLAGLCLTKLDILDGLPEIKICVGYRLDGKVLDTPPLLIDRFGECEPVYESVAGLERADGRRDVVRALPKEAKAYLRRIEELAGVPIDIVSTGPSARRRHHATASV